MQNHPSQRRVLCGRTGGSLGDSLRSLRPLARPKEFSELVVDSLPDFAVRDRIEQIIRAKVTPEEAAKVFGTSGYVVDTVPLALHFAQCIAENPLSTVLARTIRCGGDTDTIASITGQVAGTVVGAASIPGDFFDDVDEGEEIFRIASHFARFVASVRD